MTNNKLLILCCLAMALFGFSGSPYADNFTGRVEFAHVYKLNPGVDGEIGKVHVKVGDAVKAGDLLAELKNEHVYFSLESAKSRKVAIAAQLEESKRSFERDTVLYEEGSLSRVELQLSELTFLQAMMELDEAKAEYAKRRFELGQTRLVAPVDGDVLRLGFHAGERIAIDSANLPVILLGSRQRVVTISMQIGEQAVPQNGEVLELRVKASGQVNHFSGRVESVDRYTRPGFALIKVVSSNPLPEVGYPIELVLP
ncbi:MAG: efflux RND transporter periplasmic adaptor subunit [Gammaproteobacteria bacterium]|nr:efflux RND transporter periplasmic adaptor subunit [Gammaproteobacteria bacterium]